ncbi:MAG TPA: SoxR reducing system RseC family protein [Thermodesulfovibrionales bacterium]|nr:SoxR reducing system RseC family protein [Thermodesulfovibrionales bacterium]
MKPTISQTGTVIKLDGDMALVLLHRDKSCKGCGAAVIGLCKPSGNISNLNVKNTLHAVTGDTVRINLSKSIQRKGFLFAYIIPILCFLGGSVFGHILGKEFSLPQLDVIGGFMSLVVSAIFTYQGLRKLDATSVMTIKEILSEDSFRR